MIWKKTHYEIKLHHLSNTIAELDKIHPQLGVKVKLNVMNNQVHQSLLMT